MALVLLGTMGSAPASARAQSADLPPARVTFTSEALRMDGVPDEPAWLAADSIWGFTQREPAEGRPATEHTVVRLLATRQGLYLALWAYDSLPGAIRRAQLRRDADLDSDDSFTILLDPQRDRRSAYLFSINPNGALTDAEVLGPEQSNEDWNGVWDARARVGPSGWTAEVFIPWQTLRYRREADAWGANFRRIIRRKNEEVLWRAWARTEGLRFQEWEGTVNGLAALPGRRLAELRPYAAGTAALAERSYRDDGGDSVLAAAAGTLKLGLDAKVAPAPTLTLDLTLNTDFAQVEADRQVVNLTRFPLFFPEKRPFFLEGSGIFDFGMSGRTQLFYSRRIGLASDGSPIPLRAGARLTGRAGRERIGVLAVRTGGAQGATDVVARVQHDVLSRGYVGALVTGRGVPGGGPAALSAGADFQLPFIVKRQNLVVAGFAALTRGAGSTAAGGWGLLADYPNDFMDNFIAVSRLESGFDPALGFVREAGVLQHRGAFRVFPRPRHLGIRKLVFKPIGWDVTTDLDGTLAHAFYEVQPAGARFESGDEVELNLQRFDDAPTDAFEIFPGETIPAGRYRYQRAEVRFESSAARPLGLDLEASTGEYYTGRSTALEATLTVRRAPHLIADLELREERIRLATGRFTARTARLRLDLAASPRLGTTLFLQWDNESRRMTVNARLHWIPRPGSDAYLVWNTAWPTDLGAGVPWARPMRGALVGKFVRYLRL